MTPLTPNRNSNNRPSQPGLEVQSSRQNGNGNGNGSDSMVQLTSIQYGQLIQKIDHLEHTQMQQRQVIACLAGKLQDLEYKNQNNQLIAAPNPDSIANCNSNLNSTPNHNHNANPNPVVPPNIPRLPPIVAMQSHSQCQQQTPVQVTSVPMPDLN